MSLDSGFNARLMVELNTHFSIEDNYFVWRVGSKCPTGFRNAVTDPKWFSPEYINQHHGDWDQIFLHELFLTDRQILQLSDEAAKKITWVVWGHDLYRKPPKPTMQPRSIAVFVYRWLRQNSVFFRGYQHKVATKVSQFRRIAIGYPYDEVYIRKKYGSIVPVVYGPYFSHDTDRKQADALRYLHAQQKHDSVNILIGHCGAPFIEHEKYLKKLVKYKNQPIHIFMVMSYLATSERITQVRMLAESLFTPEQFTIITELMPKEEYYQFLTRIDIAIFPFLHQSALGNTKRLAYMGVKLYFHPNGVLAKGFLSGGVDSCDCRKIGKLSYKEFSAPTTLPASDAPLFNSFDYNRNIQAWGKILS